MKQQNGYALTIVRPRREFVLNFDRYDEALAAFDWACHQASTLSAKLFFIDRPRDKVFRVNQFRRKAAA